MANLFHGKGGGQSSPSDSPDSLKSEDIIEIALAVSEGPIRGLTRGAKSFYVGDTPLVSESGGTNFDKFAIGVHPGYAEGIATPLDLKLGGISSNDVVGVQLFSGVEVVRQTESVLRGKIDTIKVRLDFTRLMESTDDGARENTAEFQLQYKLTAAGTWTDFYPGTTTVSIKGKTTSNYVRDFSVSVPRVDDDDWMIRVIKISADSDTTHFADMAWDSFQEITIGKATYPDTAIVHALGVATGQFSSIPEFGGIYDGLIVRVPSNYNADARTYDETVPWDGSLKFSWTNNPAWILYDLIVNTRYGLAAHRPYIDANRFDFYLAAKWCDELVLIGDGPSHQPRYTFNAVINEPRQAMEMLNYVAGSFNALVWDDLNGKVHLRVDKDDPASQIFTPENVTAEGFNYTFTDITARANDVSVSFVNPNLDWNTDRRRVPDVTTDEEAIAKFGRIPLDFIAVGCTDPNEAVRKAQVRVLSAQTETTMCTFQTTRPGALLTLFDVILIADPVMGWSQSGRLTRYDSNYIYFRDQIYMETTGDYACKLQTATGIVEVNVHPEAIGYTNCLLLNSPLPENLPRYTVFTLEDSSGFGYAKPFRVLSIEEVEGSAYLFKINCVEINRNKYSQSNIHTDFSEIQYSFQTPSVPGAPTNFVAQSGDDYALVDPLTGVVTTRIFASWRKPFGAVVNGYVFEYRKLGVDLDWISTPTDKENIFIQAVEPGAHYSLRVASIDHNNVKSAWAVIADYIPTGKSMVPANVISFTATGGVFQIVLSWIYSAAKDIHKVEIWSSTTNDLASAFKLTDLSYPTSTWTHLGLDVNVTIYYWLRVQDTSGNYSDFTSPARSATTVSDPSAILDLLEGQITESQLWADLNSRINLVDGPSTLLGSVAQQVKTEADARVAALAAEAAARGAAITNEQTIRQSADDSLASSITTLTAASNANTAAITNEQTARTSADTALTNSLTALSASVASNNALILNEQTARVAGDSALTVSYNSLSTQVGANTAAISNESVARSNADSSISASVNTLTTTVNGHTASIQNLTTSVNGVYAEWFLKTDVNGFISGFGLANSGTSSQFIVSASAFAFALPGQTSKFPFLAGLVNGVQTVGINGALVIDGSITVRRANIVTAAIDTLRVAGNAITVPAYLNGFGGASNVTPGQSIQVGSLSVAYPDSATIVAIVTWQSSNPGAGTNTKVELKADGVSFLSLSDSALGGFTSSHCASAKVTLAAGTRNFTINFANDWTSGSWSLWSWSVTLLGVMR